MALSGFGLSAVLLAGCSPTPSIGVGRELYETNGCASCHGLSGHGDGPTAATLPSKPIDFHDASLFKRGASEAAIAQTIAEGVSIVHVMPSDALRWRELFTV